MKFPWHKYIELPAYRKNTLQIFITTSCNLKCEGCFVRHLIEENTYSFISMEEYKEAVIKSYRKGVKQINLIGGEPLLHPSLIRFIEFNNDLNLKTTIYTNGILLDKFKEKDFRKAKIRISIYNNDKEKEKSIYSIPLVNYPVEFCYMVSRQTTVFDLLSASDYIENNFNCKVFFISSLRELDNQNKEFFEDTDLTKPLLEYKKLVHEFLNKYKGEMEIHISKRGVFESLQYLSGNRCKFANYFVGGKIIQCPYDIINKKFQDDYFFDVRFCQHNSSCLMSKVIYKRIDVIF